MTAPKPSAEAIATKLFEYSGRPSFDAVVAALDAFAAEAVAAAMAALGDEVEEEMSAMHPLDIAATLRARGKT